MNYEQLHAEIRSASRLAPRPSPRKQAARVLVTTVAGAIITIGLGGAIVGSQVQNRAAPSVPAGTRGGELQERVRPGTPATMPVPTMDAHTRLEAPRPVLQPAAEAQLEVRGSEPLPERSAAVAMPREASNGPYPFEGVWYAKAPKDCSSGTDDPERVPLRFTSAELKFYESRCTVKSIERIGREYTLSGECVSEGTHFDAPTTITILDPDTVRVDAYEVAGIGKEIFKRCKAPKNRHARGERKPIPRSDTFYPATQRTAVDVCFGTFLKDACPYGLETCASPMKAGTQIGFMSRGVETGLMTYDVYRGASYNAVNIRLEPGCRLPRS